VPYKLSYVSFFLVVLLAGDALAFDCPKLVRSAVRVEEVAYPRGLLWRIESADGRISHLFGTIHIADPRVIELPPGVVKTLRGSGSFGMEVLLDAAAMQQMSTAMFHGGGQSLEGDLDAELFDRTAKLLGRYGVSGDAAQRLKPWAAYMTLSVPPGGAGGIPLDLFLLSLARERGITAFGLESADEQVAVFDTLTPSDQRELLVETVCHYDEFQAEIEEMIAHYVARDLGAMMRMALRYRSPLHDRLMQVLLWRRNRLMVRRMLPRLEEGGAFIAIGALHLPGLGGVLDLLHERGYSVVSVY
jgi:uncharacterized protein